MAYANVTAQSAELATIPVGTPVAVDNIAGSDFQRVKLAHGIEGAAVDASASDPFPVTLVSGALPSGAATETTLGTRLSESDFDTKTGSLTETVPATDTASSGLNGRLQRLAQRITSMIALLPAALGSGGGLKVDGSGTALPVSGTVSLGAGSQVVGHVIADTGSTTVVTGNVASTVADGANVTLGAKADAKSTATDTTAISAMSVLKQISASVQAPPSQAVTNAGTFATQSACTIADGSNAVEGATTGAAVITDATGTIQQYLRGLVKQWAAGALGVVLTAETSKVIGTVRVASGGIASGSLASGAVASGAIASGAVASGAFASGSVADGAVVTLGAKTDAKSASSDATSITIMQVLKQISFSIQAAAASVAGTLTVAAHAVTNAGTFAVQETTKVPVSTASLTSLASAATSAQLIASNAARKGLLLSNTDANAVLIKYGTTASATSFTVRLVQNAYWEMPQPIYTGRIDAIWEADGSGSLYATEL